MENFKIENLTFSYPNSERKVLNGINFTIKKGEFITLCGPSGCGKSTLLKHFKSVLQPHGEFSGRVLYDGVSLDEIDLFNQSSSIGFVMQSPDNQIVTDKVWHELAFGLESLGMDNQTIRLRVAEMASFLGIQNWFYKGVEELSGGQKQLLNLGGILAMHPSILVLDEPTSQLDPIAAVEFLSNIRRINRELGITVVITEHRLEEVFPYSDRVLVMDNGEIICDNHPYGVGEYLKNSNHSMFYSMPVPMKIYAAVENHLKCPITVREGRQWIDDYEKDYGVDKFNFNDDKNNDTKQYENKTRSKTPKKAKKNTKEKVLELEGVWFRYEKEGEDIVKGLSMSVERGEFYTILGGNGTGKTTTLLLMAGIYEPYRGKVKISGKDIGSIEYDSLFYKKLGVLPQSPSTLFIKKTLKEDLLDILSQQKITKLSKLKKVGVVSRVCRLDSLLDMHPYDLSGGEQQRAALAKVLLLEPEIILMDEPTKGLDAEFKLVFGKILMDLIEDGVTIVMVSHDIEFSAKYSDRCAMFFDGNIVSLDEPQKFFSENSFYTTAANRMTRHMLPNAVTEDDVILACGGSLEKLYGIKSDGEETSGKDARHHSNKISLYNELNACRTEAITKKKLMLSKGYKSETINLESSKKIMDVGSIVIFVILAFLMLGTMGLMIYFFGDFSISLDPGKISSANSGDPFFVWKYLALVVGFAVEVVVFITRIAPGKGKISIKNDQVKVKNRKLSKRTLAATLIVLILIPLTIVIGVYYLGDRKYYFISLLIILETMLPFVMIFESKKPQPRELIIIAVLCAIGVAGRSAFFMIPQFKPVVAIVIIAGVAFGGEAGFLVGAVTGFVSNMFFGQGPWTPWQMFAFGIIGFLAGVLFRKGVLRRNRVALSIFGGLVTFFIYGGIMNSASVIIFQNMPTKEMFYMAYLRGIPFDLIHATASVIFLWILSRPLLEKLDRIKIKYGLIEE
jgi:energy-coupling factor transport system ATP-binding protein